MSILANKPLAKKVVFAVDSFSVEFTDGRILNVPLAYFPRLLHATRQQQEQYTISGGGKGLHWDNLDEDISVENLLLGFGDTTIKGKSTIQAA